MKSARLTALLLLIGMIASCGAQGEAQTQTSEINDTETAATTEAEFVYTYPKTFDGSEFRIHNLVNMWGMRSVIDREEQTGDAFDDAMYNRARMVEEMLDVKIVETNSWDVVADAQAVIMAGEDAYDIIYPQASKLYNLISEGYLVDLSTLEGLMLNRPWWSQSYNNPCIINGKLFSAVGASQLMYIDSIWALFFNEDMMTDLGLEFPYQLVREGKWTLDRLAEYMKSGAQLNGDTSFDWNENGKSVYGYSGTAGDMLLAGCGEFFVESENGELKLTFGTPRFYDVADKISSIMKKNGGNRFSDVGEGIQDGQPGNYITTFETQRALIGTAELTKTARMRDKSFSFGVLPFPKYDEAQEAYHAQPFKNAPGMSIPVTVKDPERSAIIADALAYLGNEMVLPVFREVTLEQKGLRNDDSIEMLDIIIKSATPNLCYIFQLADTLRSDVAKAMLDGEAYASIIASGKPAVEATLAKINIQ